MKKETLRLFKGYLGETSDKVNEHALKFGLLIPDTAPDDVVDEAIKQYGKDGKKWNQTFHKDFEIVHNAPIEDLITQQMIHYITTYGFESLGMYNSDLVYIPNEKLEIPELDVETVEFITIRPLTPEKLTEKLMVLLTSGIALSEQTVKDIMVLSDFIDKDRFDEIKNREIKITLYSKYNVMPRNPDEFLRYLIFKLTGATLKIQNVDTIRAIKNSDKQKALEMLQSYLIKTPNGYNKLSSIFLRNKNLFLALKMKKTDIESSGYTKTRKEINAIINKLRKLSVVNHKPLKTNILDQLTAGDVLVDIEEVKKELDKVTIFREVRILNGVLYRLNGNDNIVYKIRNGKSYVKKLERKNANYIMYLETISNTIREHLVNRLSAKVAGKRICIPENVTYVVPTSEKQFNGNIPEGSYVEVPRNDNIVYGVYWKNIENGDLSGHAFYGEIRDVTREERVDLDLKSMNKNEVFGWDASYRSETSDILFSGDMTDAKLPNGASELFYVGQNYGYGAFLLTLNMFTGNSQDVPFEFVIAKATHRPETRVHYVLDPNNILEKIDMTIKRNERQMVVGLITIGDTIRFYFNDFSTGGAVGTSRGCSTSARNEITMGAFDYLQAYGKTQLKLKDLLIEAGATITDKPTIMKTAVRHLDNGSTVTTMVEEPVDIDLSLNTITKETLIDLLRD